MNISFDLDSTLIPSGKEFPVEKRSQMANFFSVENLRLGTVTLFKKMKNKGCTIHIYTTSYRPLWKIRLMFLYYGIRVNRIVNEKENQLILRKQNIYASKYPPAFKFDVHIDDLIGVGMEGEKYDFNAIIINPSDLDWINTVLCKLEEICIKEESNRN